MTRAMNRPTLDFWAHVDAAVKTMQQPPAVDQTPPPPKGKKR